MLYGAADGLLLSGFPMLSSSSPRGTGACGRCTGLAAVVLPAMLASLAMTAAYHVGYRRLPLGEASQAADRRPDLERPTLVTLNPLGAVVAHAGMHVAAVAHSYDTDVYLPPHE